MTLGPVMLDIEGLELGREDRECIAHPQVGGVILFARNFASREQLTALVSEIHAVKSPPVLVGVDQEGGRVQRFGEPFSRLPAAAAIGKRYDVDADAGVALAHEIGWLMAAEMRAVGIDFSFAPVADLDWGASQIIGDRAFHARPRVVGELAIAYMAGMHEAGMAATAKHFPGHGGVVADSHVDLPIDRRSNDELKRDLKPFRTLARAGIDAMMTAHVVFPDFDDLPATFSKRWLIGVLRRRLRFDGVIFSDDLSMAGAAGIGTPPQRAAAALAAGCDMLPVCNDRAAVREILKSLADHADPVSRLRLTRLHGRDAPNWRVVAGARRRRLAHEMLAALAESPQLRLDA